MNNFSMHGIVGKDAECHEMVDSYGKKNLITFVLYDYGVSNKKTIPLSIEVHFSKDVAVTICPYLVKGKEVFVSGFLREKDYVDNSGISHRKYYVSANTVEMAGKCEVPEGVDDGKSEA